MTMAFNRLNRADGFLSPHGPTDSSERHESEAPAPSHSAYGSMFRRAMLRACPAEDTPQTAMHPEAGQGDWRGNVVRSQAPLYKEGPFMDLIGAFMARPAQQVPVIPRFRYQGQLPMDVQPQLDKTHPWFDPFRGQP